MKRILPYILLMLSICCGCSRSVIEAEGEALLEEAEKAYLVGNYIESMKSVHAYISKAGKGEIRTTPELDTKAYKFLGNIHLIYGDRQSATQYYQTAIKTAEKLEDKDEKLKLIYNLVIVFQELGRHDEMEKRISEIRHIRGVDEGLRKYFYYCACAIRDQSETDNDRSFRWMEKALDTVDEYSLEPYLKYNPYRFICQTHLSNGDYVSALPVLKRYEAVIKSTGEGPECELECAQALANAYTVLGDSGGSMKYQRRVEHLSDSLDSQQQFLKVKREYQTAESSGQGYRFMSPDITVVLAVVALVFLALSAVAVRNTMKSRRKDSLLHTTSEKDKAEHEEDKPIKLHSELFDRIDYKMENERLYAGDITVESLAAMLGTNVKYVSQAVSSNTGRNFRSYVNGLRIREACRMFSSGKTGITVQDVAKATGFVSQSVFIGAFRRETGLTPSAYLKRASAASSQEDKTDSE